MGNMMGVLQLVFRAHIVMIFAECQLFLVA